MAVTRPRADRPFLYAETETEKTVYPNTTINMVDHLKT